MLVAPSPWDHQAAELVSFPLLHGGDDGDDRRHGHQEHTHSPDPAEEQPESHGQKPIPNGGLRVWAERVDSRVLLVGVHKKGRPLTQTPKCA